MFDARQPQRQAEQLQCLKTETVHDDHTVDILLGREDIDWFLFGDGS